jgi:hypothetical protein
VGNAASDPLIPITQYKSKIEGLSMLKLRISVLIVCGVTTSLLAQDQLTANSNPTVSFAYVGSFTAPGRITAFAVQKNGSAQNVSGSPFTGPSQQIVVSSGFVFGTDGTNIAVFTRAPNGALHLTSTINGVAHNDTPQGSGVGSLTLDRTASSLYAGEINFQGADNDAYAEFANLHNGKLEFRANTQINVDFHSRLQFSQNDQFAYGDGCFFISFDLFAFHRTGNGALLSFDPGNTFPPNPNGDFLCPDGMAASAKGFLALSYGPAQSGSKQNILTYRITATGSLEEISKSVIATNLVGANLQFDPTGSFLAAGGQSGIEAFKLNSDGTLSRVGHVVEPSVTFEDIHWDNAGHLYAISNAALYIFTLQSSGLALTGSPHPVSHAGWLAVLPVP